MAAGDEHDNGANGPDGGDHDEQPYEFDDDVFLSLIHISEPTRPY